MNDTEGPNFQPQQERHGWFRTAASRPASPLCETCQSFLVRPTCDPATQQTSSQAHWSLFRHLYFTEASRAAANGCVLCKLVVASQAISTAEGQRELIYPLDGFALRLQWASQSSQFYNIQMSSICQIPSSDCSYNIRLAHQGDQQDRTIDYPSPLSTASQLCGDLARRWLGDCMRNHTKCSERYVDSDQLPTRLIDVGPLDGTNEPRIVLSCELQGFRDVRYVTLSHRWPSDPVAKLESTNLESLRRCIPLKSLPRTFVDAIEVTRALSVRYLWIDSLCIFQDSIDDWQAQATEMGKVYQNGLCNLAATGAATATGGANTDGLFQERDSHSVTPSKIRIRFKGHDSTYTAVPQELWGQWISTSTLNRRGWVFQERMLSPRTLHFSSQLFWECREMQACETYPYGLPAAAEKSTEETTRYYTESDGFKLPVTFKNWRGTCAQDGKGYWCKVVESYGRCFITRPEDRLVAIAGTARLLQPLLDDDYIAGLWKKDLPWNLPWLLFNVVGYVERPAGYRCPSWSWAALDYGSALISDQLVRESDRVRSLVLIQSAHIEPLGSDLYGLLNGGYLELKGQVAQISTARNIDRQGIWIDGGQYSVACYHDLPGSEGYDLVREGSLFCMPLLLRNQDGATIADCLLLRQISPHKQDYTRFGILKVSLDLEYALPEEFLWIVKFARSELPLEYCVTVTIY